MKTSAFAWRPLETCAIAMALAACGGGGLQSSGLSVNALTDASLWSPHITGHLLYPSVAARPLKVARPDRRKSWISPDAKGAPRLLVISDAGSYELDIFTLPEMQLKGQITGLYEPQGECSDGAGNIWVANTGALQMLQYSRTGTFLKSLTDPTGYPVGCAVDRATGDLAIFNIFDFSDAGEILIYKNASGTPISRSIGGFYYYYFGGYDTSDNLYVDGRDQSGVFTLGKISKGSSSSEQLSISGGTVYFPGFVQWYQKNGYLAVSDQDCELKAATCIYWIAVSGSSGTIAGSTPLSNYAGGQICDMAQGVIAANGQRYIVGGDYEGDCQGENSSVEQWAYPVGGLPSSYNDSVVSAPLGAAVSTK